MYPPVTLDKKKCFFRIILIRGFTSQRFSLYASLNDTSEVSNILLYVPPRFVFLGIREKEIEIIIWLFRQVGCHILCMFKIFSGHAYSRTVEIYALFKIALSKIISQ